MPKIKAVPLLAALILGGCSVPIAQPVTTIVEVPSSKPYRFITWSTDDSPETKRQVRAHNRAHQAVINAEKKR